MKLEIELDQIKITHDMPEDGHELHITINDDGSMLFEEIVDGECVLSNLTDSVYILEAT